MSIIGREGSTDAVAVALRRVRILGALMLFMQVSGARSGSAGSITPALTVILLVATINMISIASSRVKSTGISRVLAATELCADGVLTVFIVSFMDVLHGDVIWAILVVPVLEGALRYRVKGAVITWAGVASAYLVQELSTIGGAADLAMQADYLARLQTLVHRMGVVLLVAVPGGYLSEQLIRAIASQRQAKLDATTRGQLLEVVADAGKRVNRLDGGVFEAVTSCGGLLGFDALDVAQFDSRTESWTAIASWAAGDSSMPSTTATAEAIELAVASGRTSLVDANDADPAVRLEMETVGFAEVAVTPLHDGSDTTAAIRAAVVAGKTISQHQVECLELLAGQAVTALSNSRLVGQLQDAHEQLEHQAYHDTLTGLPNRALFQHRLEQALAGTGGQRPAVAVLFLDLDRFKEVNDSMGHEVGDQLLVAVAKRLRRAVRDGDLVARLGGDEFTVLMRPGRTGNRPSALAERICQVLSQPFRLGGQQVSVSSSVGIALAPVGGNPTEIMRQADLAMYTAKSRGPANWQLYAPELDGGALARIQMESDLRRALERGDLSLAYQPVATAADGAVLGVEALLRWPDPNRPPIGPDEFIPVAEDSGLIVELGRWVLEEACAQGQKWATDFPASRLSVSVNVSPRQLSRGGFVGELRSVLESSGLDPSRLVLEITERVLAGDDARSILDEVRGLGVRVAIDDFGQGQASMSYLHRFSVDILKIDKSFVHAGGDSPQQAAILKSIIGLAHDLGMQVVAEGVETTGQLTQLRGLSCDAVQGYLFQPPLTALEIDDVLGGTRGPASRAFPSVHHRARRTARAERRGHGARV